MSARPLRLRLRRIARRWKLANALAMLRAIVQREPMDPDAPLRHAAGKAGW